MAAVMAQATVLAAPLVYAAGIQNKVLEAMARARARGHLGLGLCRARAAVDRDLVAADDDGQYAEAIVRLLDDRQYPTRSARPASIHVERHHDWDVLARALMRVYQLAAADFTATRRQAGGTAS